MSEYSNTNTIKLRKTRYLIKDKCYLPDVQEKEIITLSHLFDIICVFFNKYCTMAIYYINWQKHKFYKVNPESNIFFNV